MAAFADGDRSIVLRTPTPPLSPAFHVNSTPPRHPPLTPNARLASSDHLAPSRSLYNPIATPSFAPTSFGTSSFGASSLGASSFGVSPTTSTTAAPTPVELPALQAPPPDSEPSWEDLPPSVVESYDLATLRSKLTFANQLIKTLSTSLSALRTTATHYTLQHKLLQLENSEAAARHQVESDITRREVEVLRLDQGAWNSNYQAVLADENEVYKRRLRKAKRSIREYRDELAESREENERLKKRIRDNRQHQLEASRSPGGGGQAISVTIDRPAVTDGEVSRAPPLLRTATAEPEDDGLAALGLLASQFLSQEIIEDNPSSHHNHHHHNHHHHQQHHPRPSATTISTTTIPRKPRKYPQLPSITTTAPPPLPSSSSSSRNPVPSLLSPLAFTAPSQKKRRRSRSRDSTISASAGEEEEGEDAGPRKHNKQRTPATATTTTDRLLPTPERKKQKRPATIIANTPPPRKFPPGATPPRRDKGAG